jgi:tetratricopeptide (TPR) repeat protein
MQIVFNETAELIKQYSKNYVIWNFMGASATQLGQFDQAVAAFLKVIEIKPDYVQAYNNLGTTYSKIGEVDLAIEAYESALSINPNYTEALNNLGQLFTKIGDVNKGVKLYQKAISIDPNMHTAYYNLGIALSELKEWEQSVDAFNMAVAVNPKFAEAYNDLGITLKKINKINDAIVSYNNALALKPYFVDAHNNLGVALNDAGEYKAALSSLETAIALDPSYVPAYNNVGTILQENKEYLEALQFYRKALEINPNYADAHYNLGATFKDLGRYQEALDAYGSAITVKPDYAEAYNDLGRLYWLMQDFTRAFELMEWRWHADGQSIGKKLESIHPTWSGEEGAEVFVWKEQGIGDEIMFGSMLSEINKKSKKLIVECDNRLIPLYERSFSRDIRFIDDRYKLSDFDYDCQIAIGSLPKHFRHKLEDFSTVSPGWLKADLDRTKALREKLQAQTKDKIIGISWFTNSAGELSHKRNIPLELLAEYLKRVPGKYVSLQYGDTAEEILEVKNQVNFELNTVNEIDLYNDIDGLAALISACDTVISIDNLTVHLAGALGVDTRVLLPEVPDIRWGITGSDAYWYDHLTLYRKDKKNGWEQQLENLTQDLLIKEI